MQPRDIYAHNDDEDRVTTQTALLTLEVLIFLKAFFHLSLSNTYLLPACSSYLNKIPMRNPLNLEFSGPVSLITAVFQCLYLSVFFLFWLTCLLRSCSDLWAVPVQPPQQVWLRAGGLLATLAVGNHKSAKVDEGNVSKLPCDTAQRSSQLYPVVQQ